MRSIATTKQERRPTRPGCLLTPDKTKARQAACFHGKAEQESYTDKMKRRIDSLECRILYGQRFATVEPVFGNLRYNKELDRLTLRGKMKVDAQWKLFRLVHNIEKLAHHGYALKVGNPLSSKLDVELSPQ